jgi:hypothetical protein
MRQLWFIVVTELGAIPFNADLHLLDTDSAMKGLIYDNCMYIRSEKA